MGCLTKARQVMSAGLIKFLGPLNMESEKIINLANGSADSDAVNFGQLQEANGGVSRRGKVRLNADGKARVIFQESSAATLKGTQTGPFDLTGIGDGGNIIVNPDGAGNQTVTINFAAGTHAGASGGSINMTAELDTKFKIRANGDLTWHTVTCNWSGCSSGSLIAAQLQAAIRALGATFGYDAITAAYSTDHYAFASAQLGTGSKIEISRADDHDCCDDLKIGPNGTSTNGTGDVANAAAATAAELATVINADLAAQSIIASNDGGALRLTSESTGYASSLVMGNSTLKTVLGLAQNATDYGSQGLGYGEDMPDANYIVQATIAGTAQASMATKNLSITNPSTSGFVVECEGTSATDYVFVTAITA